MSVPDDLFDSSDVDLEFDSLDALLEREELANPAHARWMRHSMTVTDGFFGRRGFDEPDPGEATASLLGAVSAYLWTSSRGHPRWDELDVVGLLAFLESERLPTAGRTHVFATLVAFYDYLEREALVMPAAADRIQAELAAARTALTRSKPVRLLH